MKAVKTNPMKNTTTIVFLLPLLAAVSRAQIPDDLFWAPDLERVCVYDFSGVAASDFPDGNPQFGYEILSLSHNPSTGAVSGTGTFDVVDWEADTGVTVNLSGDVEFSAKVTQAGDVIRLTRAKLAIVGDGEAEVDGEGTYTITEAKITLNFALAIEGSDVAGTFKKSSLKVKFIDPKGKKGSDSVKTDLGTTSFAFPNENRVGVTAQFALTTDSKGKVSGTADVDVGATDMGIWTLRSSSRNSQGITKLNARSNDGKQTATLFFNDAGELQAPPQFKNTAQLFGYKFKGF